MSRHGADMSRVAVVTGSNKGIGRALVAALCRRYPGDVYLTARDDERGRAAVRDLAAEGLAPRYHQLDVSDRASVQRFRDHLQQNHGGIDILVNNAAVANTSHLYPSHEENVQLIDINYRGLLTIQELLFPLLRDGARVLNISSDCGHLSNLRNKHWIEKFSTKDFTVQDVNDFVEWFLEGSRTGTFDYNELADKGTVAAYRVSKVAVSALTILQQKELAARDISVNSMHPGLVRTDMTAGVGFYSAEQAAEIPACIVLDRPELRGRYVWFDGRDLDWHDAAADYYFKFSTLTK